MGIFQKIITSEVFFAIYDLYHFFFLYLMFTLPFIMRSIDTVSSDGQGVVYELTHFLSTIFKKKLNFSYLSRENHLIKC